jgi:phosphate starvation-inducible protein PhoH and related proteins
LTEKVIIIDSLDLVKFFGINHANLKAIKKSFPKLRIVARGNELKLAGQESEIEEFQEKFLELLNYFEEYGRMNEDIIDDIFQNGYDEKQRTEDGKSGPVLYGNAGQAIKPRTHNQFRLAEAMARDAMAFAIGPAGTGKTYMAVALAVKALKNKQVKRIILTRPAVEAGENLGFLPGDLNEKIAPYLQPLFDALRDMIPSEKLKQYQESGIIQIAPLAYMRGRTLDNAYVILDEAQNSTTNQMKMFLTRMGKSARFIVTGDLTQIDLPRNQQSGLAEAMKILDKVKGISFVFFDENDVVRHDLVKKILNAYAKYTSR